MLCCCSSITSTVPKYFNVKIGNGKILWQRAWKLAPMETRAVDIRDLIARQVKDLHGAVLPPTLDQGEIGRFTPNPGEGSGRLMQIDSATQTVAGLIRSTRNFSCSYPYVICGAYLYIDTMTLAEGESSSPEYLGEVIPLICNDGGNGSCSGQSSSESAQGYSYSWVSNSPSIASVSGSSTSSTATFFGNGVGRGSVSGKISSANCSQTGSGTANVTSPPRLIFGGKDVTNDTTPVVVGQQINVSATFTPPSGITVQSQTWTIAGSTVGGYSPTLTSSVVPATYSPPSAPSAAFYWAQRTGRSRLYQLQRDVRRNAQRWLGPV